jgi:hypothetical protein
MKPGGASGIRADADDPSKGTGGANDPAAPPAVAAAAASAGDLILIWNFSFALLLPL